MRCEEPLAILNGYVDDTIGPAFCEDFEKHLVGCNPCPSAVDLTGRELTAMLEENLERTFSADPIHQMVGYVKRCLGLTAYIKIENPPGTRLQKLLAATTRFIRTRSIARPISRRRRWPRTMAGIARTCRSPRTKRCWPISPNTNRPAPSFGAPSWPINSR